MIAIILMSMILVMATFFVHQATFAFLARTIPMGARASHWGLHLLMLGIFAAHLIEILIYAFGYYLAANYFGLGVLEGGRSEGVLGLFYTSAVFYTSLGFGDVLPNDHLRFLAGIEALNGLLLIAWSASFLFAAMGHFWHCLTGTDFAEVKREDYDDKTSANENKKEALPRIPIE